MTAQKAQYKKLLQSKSFQEMLIGMKSNINGKSPSGISNLHTNCRLETQT